MMTFTKPVALALSAVLALSLSACGHKDATIEGLNDSPSPSPVVSTTVSPSPSLSSTPSPSTDAEGADEGTAAPTGEDDASAKPLPDREDNSGAKGQSVTDGHLRDGGWSDWDVQKAYRTADADEAFGAQGVSYGISDALDAMTLLFSSGDVWLPGDRKVEDFSLASTVMTPAYAKTFKGIVKKAIKGDEHSQSVVRILFPQARFAGDVGLYTFEGKPALDTSAPGAIDVALTGVGARKVRTDDGDLALAVDMALTLTITGVLDGKPSTYEWKRTETFVMMPSSAENRWAMSDCSYTTTSAGTVGA